MVMQNCWYASFGPFLYDDDMEYGDGGFFEAGRGPQIRIDVAPTQLYHVVRKSDLDSAVLSGGTDSIARSSATSAGVLASTAESKADSVVSGGTDSTARSMATSASAYAGSQDTSQATVVSVADSKAVSAASYAVSADASIVAAGGGSTDSVARSMATSGATEAESLNTSQAVNVSVADSKAESAAAAGGGGGLFGVDMNGDLEPVTDTVGDAYYELDGSDDIMPIAA